MRYSIEVVAWTVLVLTLAWAVMVVMRYAAMVINNPEAANYRIWHLTEDILFTVLWSGAVSIGLSYLLDFIIMAFTVNSISGERTAHRWDLLQLTPLSGQSIVEALYSVNQLRVWRMTMIVVGTRIAILIALLLYPLIIMPIFEGENLFYMLGDFWYDPVYNTYIGLWMLLSAFVFVVEPLWRLRATTALAMAISAQFGRLVIAMSVAFLSMVGIWVTMIGVAGALVWGVIWFANWLYDQIGYSASDDIVVAVAALAGFVLIAGAIYGMFWLLRWIGLRWTVRKSLSYREPWVRPSHPYRNPWWNALRWWLPHGAAWEQSPLFNVKVRQVPWWNGIRSPRHHFNYAALWAFMVVLLLYAGGLLLGSHFLRDSSQSFAGWRLVGWGWWGIGYAAIGVLLVLVILDIFTSLFAAQSVQRIRVSLDDDLLRLTFLTTGQIVEAYRALARIRIWTFTSVMIGAGMGLVLLAPVNALNVWAAEGTADFCAPGLFYGLLSYTSVNRVVFDGMSPSAAQISETVLTGQQCFELYRQVIFEYVPALIAILLAVIIVPIAKTRLVVALTLAIVTRFNGAVRELLRAAMLLVLLAVQCWLAWVVYDWGPPEWGSVLGTVLLLMLLGYAVERGALALTQYFIWRERIDRHAHI
ncbi:MAG: hypothetical protein AAF787_05555 [Chloroflexota bacterium]